MEQPAVYKKEANIYLILTILLFLGVLFLIYLLVVKTAKEHQYYEQVRLFYQQQQKQVPVIPENQIVEVKNPTAVENIEQNLDVERSLELLDGKYYLKAFIKNPDIIGKNLVLNDFSEKVKFPVKFGLSEIELKAINGNPFPSAKLEPLNYGRGPIVDRPSLLSFVLLDVNMTKVFDEPLLYELSFKTDSELNHLIFNESEFRTGSYILTLSEQTLEVTR